MTSLKNIKDKIFSIDELEEKVEKWKKNNYKIVFTNGCFDILHLGHIELLAKASDLGEKLIIAINSDISIKNLKGEKRPILDENSRSIIIASLEKSTNEYIDNIDLMVDSSKMISVAISVFKKIEELKLRQDDILFLIQEAKQLIKKYYSDYSIAHIIINNYKIDNVDYSELPDEIDCQFISLDIIFICLPSELVLSFKNIFSDGETLCLDNVLVSDFRISCSFVDAEL